MEWDAEGKLVRRVRLIRLKIMGEHTHRGQLTLFKVGQKGVKPFRENIGKVLPTSVINFDDSLRAGMLSSLASEFGIENPWFVHAHLGMPAEPASETYEAANSSSYPGLLTVYTICEVHIRLVDPQNVVNCLGCPQMKGFVTRESAGHYSGITFYWDWLSDVP